MNKNESEMNLPQRLSISKLSEKLNKDPFYGNEEVIHSYYNYRIIKNTEPASSDLIGFDYSY